MGENPAKVSNYASIWCYCWDRIKSPKFKTYGLRQQTIADYNLHAKMCTFENKEI